MFDRIQTTNPCGRLHDGAKVRLDVSGLRRPIFIADRCGLHYDINGQTYDLQGVPVDPKAPAILEVLQ